MKSRSGHKKHFETLDIFAAFDVKKMKDEIRSTSTSTDKAADVLNLGLNYQKSQSLFGFKGSNSASFTMSAGKLYFRDDTAKTNDDAGAKTSGNYYKLLLELSRNTVFSDKLSLSKSLKLQKALGHKNLDGSEDMSFTGQGGVKAYPEGEYSAETGYLANVELFYSLPSSRKYGHRLGVFVDAARGYAENGIGADYGRSFYDAGIGYYANYDGAFLRAQIAQRVGGTHITSESSDMRTRFLWQASWAF